MRKKNDIFDAVPALNSGSHNDDELSSCTGEQNSLKAGADETFRSDLKFDSEERRAIVATRAEIEAKVQRFQEEKMERAATAAVFSSALLAAVRREYLSDTSIPVLGGNSIESINKYPIKWFKLGCVGIGDGFTAKHALEATEGLLTAFHLPEKKRILFLVSGSKLGGVVSIHIGLQSLHCDDDDQESLSRIWNGYAKANWPGLALEEDEGVVDFGFVPPDESLSESPGIRVITGIPSGRSKEEVAATIDKLANALVGREWRYLVVAEPVAEKRVGEMVSVCRELSGRADSLKTFQLGQSLSGNSATTRSARGGTRTESQRQLGAGRVIGAVAAGAALCALAPALIPAAAATATAAAATAATGAKLMLFSLGAGTVLAGARTRTDAREISDRISETISESKNVTFTETVINKHAEAAVKLLEENIKRFELCEAIGTWEVGTYIVGEDETTAELGANVLKAILSGDNSYLEPIRIHNPRVKRGQDSNCHPLVALNKFENPNLVPMVDGMVVHHPFGECFESMKTLVNTRELIKLINFPMSNIPGVPVRRIAADMGLKNPVADDGKPKIVLGNQMYRGQILDKYPYAFDKDLLAKHALVCGINGSGKTNTILGILGHLLSSAAPFLVIEPAKQEYVDWAVSQNAKLIKKYKDEKKLPSEKAKEAAKADPHWITIYIPGREKWNRENLDRLSLNPFDFVWMNSEEKPKILEHIDRLKTIINAALPMQEVLPVLMEELIYSVYGTKNSPVDGKYICWLPRDASSRTPEFGENIPVPSFVEMANHIPDLFKRINYGNEVQHNLRAALTTRVDSFKRGWKRPLLNKQLPRHNVEEWDKLFKHPTVINLTSLASDDDKAFFMAIILMFIYEYRQEESEMMTNNRGGEKPQGLKHLLVIEEAHRILGRCEGAASVFSAAPKQKASELFSNMISEVRAYGQGILIADQIPGRLNEDAVKNTNLKIVHRLVASDDRQAMATSLNLWNDQERIIGDLHVGEALVRCDMDNEAYMVKIKKIESVES